MEESETQARANFDMGEALARSELYLQFRDTQVSLMVDKKAYHDLIQKIADMNDAHAKEMKEMEDELTLTQKTKMKLEDEMAEIRLDQKLQAKSLPRKIKELEDNMINTVQEVINYMEVEKDKDSKTVMQGFNYQFGSNKQRYLDMLHETQSKLRHFSRVLAESKSMHSNLPTRIKRLLEDQSKEELLFMLDTLSFEDGVLEYFEKKFPQHQPQRWPTTLTPSTKLLDVEVESAAEASRRVPTP
uniref:Uncharacterized protein n=1 Tax=Eutreptiella gymnastica TaxID=73025 RepID=A0A7S4GM80_9EUGL